MPDNFEVKGLRELEKKLIMLGATVAKKTLSAAGRQAMKPVLATARNTVPVDTGSLKSALAISSRKGKGKSVVNINVGATKKRALKSQSGAVIVGANQKAIAQEYGTSKQKARPFLRPALTSNAAKVVVIFRKELKQRIEKANNK